MEIGKITTWLQEEQNKLYAEAQALADKFWEEKHRRRGNKGDPGKYGVRVKCRIAGISIQWFQVGYYKSTGEDTAWKPLFRSISRGARESYSVTRFKKAAEWELGYIEDMEKVFGRLRVRSDALVKIHRAITLYEKAVNGTDG